MNQYPQLGAGDPDQYRGAINRSPEVEAMVQHVAQTRQHFEQELARQQQYTEQQIAQANKRTELQAMEAQLYIKEAEEREHIAQQKLEDRERQIFEKLQQAEQEREKRRRELLNNQQAPQAEPVPKPRSSASDHQSWDNSPRRQSGGSYADHQVLRMKPDRFDGIRTLWPEYRENFEILASLQGWTDSHKAQALAVSLSGNAQTVLIGMSEDDTKSYEAIVQKLEAKYDPVGREIAHRAELKNLRRKVGQGPAEWASLVERWVLRAYPQSSGVSKEITVLEHFISGISDPSTRQWLELKGLQTVAEATSALIHYESVMVTHKGEVPRKPREAIVGAMEERPEMEPEECMIAAVGTGANNNNGYQQRYGTNEGKQGQNLVPRPAPQGQVQRPVYQEGQVQRPAYQGPYNGNKAPQGNSMPNTGIVRMFRAQERQI